jgi:hypothetical protein
LSVVPDKSGDHPRPRFDLLRLVNQGTGAKLLVQHKVEVEADHVTTPSDVDRYQWMVATQRNLGCFAGSIFEAGRKGTTPIR